MTILEISLACCLLVCFFILCVSLYFNYKHGILILSVQDSIEDSLDILDKKHKRISDVLEIPIFFDSVEVRQVVNDIKSCQDSIVLVANLISAIDQNNQETMEVKE
jgi:hypothetical protein